MKKSFLPAVAAALFVFACQKPGNQPAAPIPEDGKKFAVNFNVSGFSQQIAGANARTADTSVLQNAQLLVYTAFDATNRRVIRSIIKNSGDATFGQFTDSLPRGRYVIAVAAIKDSIYSKQSTDKWAVMFKYPGTDAFYQKIALNVDSTVNENITLERIVSKLTVHIKGKIPYNTHTFTLSPSNPDPSDINGLQGALDYYTGAIPQRTANGGYDAWQYILPDSLQGTTDIDFDTYILNPSGNRTISFGIYTKDTLGKVLASRSVYDVHLETNKVTLLSGYLFDSIPTSGGLNVKVNSQWKQDSIVAQF